MPGHQEFRQNWQALLACTIGLTFGVSFCFYIISPSIKPMEAAFGWSQTAIATSTSFLATGVALGTLIAGRASDLIGARRMALLSMACCILLVVALSQLGRSLAMLYLLFFAIGLLGAGCGPITYTQVIVRLFDKSRGLALGIALAGIGLGSFIAPILVEAISTAHGWRTAFIVIAAIMLVTMPIIFWGLPKRTAAAHPLAARQETGCSLAEAARDPRFWIIAATLILFGLIIVGLIVHMVPVLIDHGMASAHAARTAALYGISLIGGRVAIGFMLDRFPAPMVVCGAFLVAALGCAAFPLGGVNLAFVTVLAIGFTAGAEIDILSYLVRRYFGLKNYGSIYAILFSLYTFSSLSSPIIVGKLLILGGAQLLFGSAVVAFSAAAIISLLLLPYDRIYHPCPERAVLS